MPTYQYACTSCGEQLEAVQKFSDDPLTTCPACQGRLRKVFSPVGVVFKGSGFYKTDSRSSSKKPSADKGAEKAAEKTTEKKAPDAGSSSPASSSGNTSSTGSAGQVA